MNLLAFSRKESGKLRVCLDPRDLNSALKRTYHRTPTVEEITHKLAGLKFFTKMDAKHDGLGNIQSISSDGTRRSAIDF